MSTLELARSPKKISSGLTCFKGPKVHPTSGPSTVVLVGGPETHELQSGRDACTRLDRSAARDRGSGSGARATGQSGAQPTVPSASRRARPCRRRKCPNWRSRSDVCHGAAAQNPSLLVIGLDARYCPPLMCSTGGHSFAPLTRFDRSALSTRWTSRSRHR